MLSIKSTRAKCPSLFQNYLDKKNMTKIKIQCSAVQCSAVQCSAVQCSAVQCSAVQCSAVQCSAILDNICNTAPEHSTAHDIHYTHNTALLSKLFPHILEYIASQCLQHAMQQQLEKSSFIVKKPGYMAPLQQRKHLRLIAIRCCDNGFVNEMK